MGGGEDRKVPNSFEREGLPSVEERELCT